MAARSNAVPPLIAQPTCLEFGCIRTMTAISTVIRDGHFSTTSKEPSKAQHASQTLKPSPRLSPFLRVFFDSRLSLIELSPLLSLPR